MICGGVSLHPSCIPNAWLYILLDNLLFAADLVLSIDYSPISCRSLDNLPVSISDAALPVYVIPSVIILFCSVCHPGRCHCQSEEAGGEVWGGLGPTDCDSQSPANVQGPELPPPTHMSLLYQCKCSIPYVTNHVSLLYQCKCSTPYVTTHVSSLSM